MKVWSYLSATGRFCADTDFKSEAQVWQVMLGWPNASEIEAAKRRGDLVMQIEIALLVEATKPLGVKRSGPCQ